MTTSSSSIDLSRLASRNGLSPPIGTTRHAFSRREAALSQLELRDDRSSAPVFARSKLPKDINDTLVAFKEPALSEGHEGATLAAQQTLPTRRGRLSNGFSRSKAGSTTETQQHMQNNPQLAMQQHQLRMQQQAIRQAQAAAQASNMMSMQQGGMQGINLQQRQMLQQDSAGRGGIVLPPHLQQQMLQQQAIRQQQQNQQAQLQQQLVMQHANSQPVNGEDPFHVTDHDYPGGDSFTNEDTGLAARTKPIRNAEGIVIRKDGRPDMRSVSSAMKLRKMQAEKEAGCGVFDADFAFGDGLEAVSDEKLAEADEQGATPDEVKLSKEEWKGTFQESELYFPPPPRSEHLISRRNVSRLPVVTKYTISQDETGGDAAKERMYMQTFAALVIRSPLAEMEEDALQAGPTGQQYHTANDYPPSPRRTQPGQWQRPGSPAGANTTSKGADRFRSFPRLAPVTHKASAQDRGNMFQAWQEMQNQEQQLKAQRRRQEV